MSVPHCFAEGIFGVSRLVVCKDFGRCFVVVRRFNRRWWLFPFWERTPYSRGVFFAVGRFSVMLHFVRRGV